MFFCVLGILLLFPFALTIINAEDDTGDVTSVIELSLPARKFCTVQGAYVDFQLNSCVLIDRQTEQIPEFDPCPPNTVVDGRYCLGRVETEPEIACQGWQRLNRRNECNLVEQYNPPQNVCPEGFKLYRSNLSSKIHVCHKKVFQDPLYIHEDNPVNISNSSLSPRNRDLSETVVLDDNTVLRVSCSPGFRLERKNRSQAISSDEEPSVNFVGQFRQLSGSKKNSTHTCVSKLTVPPVSPETRCIGGFQWSATQTACVRVISGGPVTQCPHPDLIIDRMRGDWETPRFYFDSESKRCIADRALAIHPRCPPGWSLEGAHLPTCRQKKFSPVHYDCSHLPGFSLRVYNYSIIGPTAYPSEKALCEARINVQKYAAFDTSFPTKRSRHDSALLSHGATPWQTEEAYEKTIELLNEEELLEGFDPDERVPGTNKSQKRKGRRKGPWEQGSPLRVRRYDKPGLRGGFGFLVSSFAEQGAANQHQGSQIADILYEAPYLNTQGNPISSQVSGPREVGQRGPAYELPDRTRLSRSIHG